MKPLTVKVADGGVLHCDQEMLGCEWLVQGISFSSTLKVLPLGCYEVILGMDWLEHQSPMTVHWKDKVLSFEHQGKTVTLWGVQGSGQQCGMVSAVELFSLIREEAVTHLVQLCSVEAKENDSLPKAIDDLLEEFVDLFAEPKGLPPPRFCDHSIPLI